MTTLLFAFSAVARDHSALNGTWTLVPAKSDFAGQPVVQTGTVTIAFGCTGGQHRSVMIADEVRRRLLRSGYKVKGTHRDIVKAG